MLSKSKYTKALQYLASYTGLEYVVELETSSGKAEVVNQAIEMAFRFNDEDAKKMIGLNARER
jgi:hypothetical protein